MLSPIPAAPHSFGKLPIDGFALRRSLLLPRGWHRRTRSPVTIVFWTTRLGEEGPWGPACPEEREKMGSEVTGRAILFPRLPGETAVAEDPAVGASHLLAAYQGTMKSLGLGAGGDLFRLPGSSDDDRCQNSQAEDEGTHGVPPSSLGSGKFPGIIPVAGSAFPGHRPGPIWVGLP